MCPSPERFVAELRRGSLESISCVPTVHCGGIRYGAEQHNGKRVEIPAGRDKGTRFHIQMFTVNRQLFVTREGVCAWYGLDRHLRELSN